MRQVAARNAGCALLTSLLFTLGGCLEEVKVEGNTNADGATGTGNIVDTGGGAGGGGAGGSNSAPAISGSPPSVVLVGEMYSYTPTATDADGDTLTFVVNNMPGWLNFNPITGTLSGQPGPADVADYSGISISVTDGASTAALPDFSISVSDIGVLSVTLSWNPPTENADGTQLSNLAAYKFYYGMVEGSFTHEVYVPNPGLSSYTVQNLTANTYYFSITAINEAGAESQFSNVAVWTP